MADEQPALEVYVDLFANKHEAAAVAVAAMGGAGGSIVTPVAAAAAASAAAAESEVAGATSVAPVGGSCSGWHQL